MNILLYGLGYSAAFRRIDVGIMIVRFGFWNHWTYICVDAEDKLNINTSVEVDSLSDSNNII
jgi:hypothetical protein